MGYNPAETRAVASFTGSSGCDEGQQTSNAIEVIEASTPLNASPA